MQLGCKNKEGTESFSDDKRNSPGIYPKSGTPLGNMPGFTDKGGRPLRKKRAPINYVATFLFLEVEMENPKLASIKMTHDLMSKGPF